MAHPALPDPASLETARPGPDRPRARPRRGRLPTVLASAACFLVVFEFLAFQLRSGRDPAISTSAASRRLPGLARSSSTGESSSAGSSSRPPDVSGVPVGGGSPSSGTSSTASARPVAPRCRTRTRSRPGDEHIMSRCDITFAAMGSEVRLIIEDHRPDARTRATQRSRLRVSSSASTPSSRDFAPTRSSAR